MQKQQTKLPIYKPGWGDQAAKAKSLLGQVPDLDAALKPVAKRKMVTMYTCECGYRSSNRGSVCRLAKTEEVEAE